MIRDVDLVSYLPPFMIPYEELKAAMKAENPEFRAVWEAVDRLFCNRFLSTADEYGLSRFETVMGIFPRDTDSLEERRKRVRSRWTEKLPYTARVLESRLADCLKEYNFSIEADFESSYKMEVIIYSTSDILAEELRHILDIMVPENVATEIVYERVTSGLPLKLGVYMEQADIIELKQNGGKS